MIFQRWEYAYLLVLLIPTFLFFRALSRRKISLLLKIFTKQYLHVQQIYRRFFFRTLLLFLLFFVFLLFVLDPVLQLPSNEDNATDTKFEPVLHIFLDVSRSMYVSGAGSSRIEPAIVFIEKVLQAHPNLLFTFSVFTDNISLISPMNSDQSYLGEILKELRTRPVIPGSTDLVSLFTHLERTEALYFSPAYDNKLLVLTDWESHTEIDISDFNSLEYLYSDMYFVSVGSEMESIVLDETGKALRNEDGSFVYSKARPELARDFSRAYNAQFINVQTQNSSITIGREFPLHASISWILSLAMALLLLGYILLE